MWPSRMKKNVKPRAAGSFGIQVEATDEDGTYRAPLQNVTVRNLENDPLYADRVWNWSPQIWMAGGLRADAFSLRDAVYY